MGQESSEVRRQIDEKREQLGENIHELQDKVRSKFDWRTQFEDHCGAVLGTAFGVGLLLSRIGGSGGVKDLSTRLKENFGSGTEQGRFSSGTEQNRFASRAGDSRDTSYKPRSEHREKLSNFVNSVEGALIGVASTKVRDFLNEVVPGFSEHYQESQQHRRPTSSYQEPTSSYQENQTMSGAHVAGAQAGSSGNSGSAYGSPAD